MKKILSVLFSLVLFCGSISALPVKVVFEMGHEDDSPIIPLPGKGPVCVPTVCYDGFVMEFEENHNDYTLYIIDANDIIVYSVYVPSTQAIVYLPSTLSGTYQLRLEPDGSNVCFYGYILL